MRIRTATVRCCVPAAARAIRVKTTTLDGERPGAWAEALIGQVFTHYKVGQPLARSLETATVFPEMSVEMIEVGESTGALPAMLNSVAEFYEEDVTNALATAMALIEPLILIVMGIVVAFVLISLYLPIFSLGAGGIH